MVWYRRRCDDIITSCQGNASRVPGPSLQWRHNGGYSVSNHQPYDCLLMRLFRRRSKQTWKLRVTGLCAGNSPGPVNFPHKWPVTRKMFPFDDVIMFWGESSDYRCLLFLSKKIIGYFLTNYCDILLLILLQLCQTCYFKKETEIEIPQHYFQCLA